MLAMLLLLALHAGGGVELQSSPEPSRASKDVVCVTCGGEGIVARDCWLCGGDGRHACLGCTSFQPTPPRRWQSKWIPAALIQAINEQIQGLAEGLGDFDFKFPGAPKRSPKSTRLKPGELSCPARCRSGKLLHVQDWVDCKVCRAGKFRCEHCKKGEVDCGRCEQSGRCRAACDSCAGLGRVPDPTGQPVSTCPWCRGAAKRACGTCVEPAAALSPCTACFGRVELPCSTCRGLGVLACEQCGGRGRYGRDKERCELCARKGKVTCPECDGGLVTCGSCGPEASEPSDCLDCGGAGEHPCNGCATGAYGAWEQTAAWLLARGARAPAVAWLTEARKRCERRYGAALRIPDAIEDLEVRETYRLAIQAEAEAELERLARAVAAARSEPPSDGD